MKFIRLLALSIFCVSTLSACGKNADSKATTQVAAKVNGDEISIHQINNSMSRIPNAKELDAKQAGSQMLEQLIDQQLLVQKAIQNKIDRDPNVMMAIESAKRQIISQAYIERVAATVAKPSSEEIKNFYNAHPELFSQRRVYRMQEISFNVQPEQQSAIESQLGKARSLNDLANWLKAQNIKFSADSSIKAAEQFPLEMLPKIHALKDGQIIVLPTGNSYAVVQIAGSQQVPLGETEAVPYIEQFLQNQKRGEFAKNEVKQLRVAAKVEYMGPFRDQSKTVGKKETTENISASKESPKSNSSVVDKGISGLK